MDTYVVKRLEQARLLTDPFKLKLLKHFAGKPATTKQVADRLGEKAPRLYRHVDALFAEGLLELVEEKPKRGTIERYYRTVAARFEVDPNLFSPSATDGDGALGMVRSLFRETESDLLRCFEQHGDHRPSAEELPLVIRVAVRGTSKEIGRLRQKLDEWLAECDALPAEWDESSDLQSYAGLLAFYPEPDED